MKTRLFVTAATLMAILSGGVFAAALAQPDLVEALSDEQPRFSGRCLDGPQRGFGPRLEMMSEVLELSPAQRTQLTELLEQHRAAVQPLREQHRQLRQTLRQAGWSAEYDEAQLRGLAVRNAELQAELAVARTQFLQQVRQLLTPAQQARAEKLHALFDGPPRRGHRGRM